MVEKHNVISNKLLKW